jgi:SagB-type dehydrogenase family enzyme
MWRKYHESTKHSAESLRRSRHTLDWANQPDPFRHYEGVPILDLPADPPSPEIPALSVLQGERGNSDCRNGAEFLSELLFHSAAISASKVVPSTGEKYALRVNPSSGNLHPTEFHFVTRGLIDWPDGLYHYRPSSHMAEQRASGHLPLTSAADHTPVTLLLTSIAWREAWKYQSRAYRYCLHDIGHAWQSVALAAQAMGCDTFAIAEFPDDEVASLCGLESDEWPMLIVELSGRLIPTRGSTHNDVVWFGGRANTLSIRTVEYPLIDQMHAATKRTTPFEPHATHDGNDPSDLHRVAQPSRTDRDFGTVARTRRSALNFRGGASSMSSEDLSTILRAASGVLHADFATTRFIDLYAYVHRVGGVEAGVYRFCRNSRTLELIRAGDQRVVAAGLSLGQDLAGNACVAFSMIGDLERATHIYGDRGYRYVHFEAGAIGQQMYLGAKALGYGATGIGAFFDDRVHEYLGLDGSRGQVVYHFAIGYPVADTRVQAL